MRFLVLTFLLLLGTFTFAQNDPLYSHYMFNPTYYNPGWMGNEKTAFAAFQHRTQWAGYATTFDGSGGAPSSQLLTAVIPMQGMFSSSGLLVSNDRLGIESTLRIQAGVAYNLDVQPGTISFGLMPGVISRTLRLDELRFENPTEPLAGTRETQMAPDLATGVFFQSVKGYFAGVGVDHLLQPSLIQIEANGLETRGQLVPTYYFHGGHTFSLNRDLDIRPTFLMRTDFNGYTVDISSILNYRATMWGGLSYRRSEALTLLLGYNLLENKELKVGYSFDYVVKDQEAKRPTSHEIFIRYDLPDLILGGRKAVKTPRFSF